VKERKGVGRIMFEEGLRLVVHFVRLRGTFAVVLERGQRILSGGVTRTVGLNYLFVVG